MSVERFTDLVCDGCDQPYWSYLSQATATKQRKEARTNDGWVNRGKKDYCKHCRNTALGEDHE